MEKAGGKVVEILGHVNDPGTDILSIVRGYDLPTEFPEKIMNRVERVAGEVSTADMAGRMDLRDWQTVTIDGEDAKDLDDAITSTKEGMSTVWAFILRMSRIMCRSAAPLTWRL